MAAELTAGMQKLLKEKAYCQIATLMPDGSPQLTETWVDTDGQHILINTAEGRQKVRNVRRDPRVAAPQVAVQQRARRIFGQQAIELRA